LIASLSLGPGAADAQEPESTEGAQADSAEVDSHGFAFIPAIFYTPETKLAGGASVLFFFRGRDAQEGARPSTVAPTVIFTQQKQVIAFFGAELYPRQERYRVAANVGFLKFPDKFYGIGPDTPDELEEDYTPETALASLALQKYVYKKLSVGVRYEFGYSEITEKEEDGLLASGLVPGGDGGTVSGAGVLVSWDSRDNVFYPTTGSFHQGSATFFAEALGSDFAFARYNVNLRLYSPFISPGIVALQLFTSFTFGDPPFQMMPKLGGANLMRGYYDGRFRDHHAIVIQADYRTHLWWRFGFALFAGFGNVAPRLDRFAIGDVKESIGFGFRYVFDKKENVMVRMDFGFRGGTPGPYITIGEAF
jgi:hypothetical protein